MIIVVLYSEFFQCFLLLCLKINVQNFSVNDHGSQMLGQKDGLAAAGAFEGVPILLDS